LQWVFQSAVGWNISVSVEARPALIVAMGVSVRGGLEHAETAGDILFGEGVAMGVSVRGGLEHEFDIARDVVGEVAMGVSARGGLELECLPDFAHAGFRLQWVFQPAVGWNTSSATSWSRTT